MHTFYASEAVLFVTNDKKTREKSNMVYELLKLKTRTISIEEVVNRFL